MADTAPVIDAVIPWFSWNLSCVSGWASIAGFVVTILAGLAALTAADAAREARKAMLGLTQSLTLRGEVAPAAETASQTAGRLKALALSGASDDQFFQECGSLCDDLAAICASLDANDRKPLGDGVRVLRLELEGLVASKDQSAATYRTLARLVDHLQKVHATAKSISIGVA